MNITESQKTIKNYTQIISDLQASIAELEKKRTQEVNKLISYIEGIS